LIREAEQFFGSEGSSSKKIKMNQPEEEPADMDFNDEEYKQV